MSFFSSFNIAIDIISTLIIPISPEPSSIKEAMTQLLNLSLKSDVSDHELFGRSVQWFTNGLFKALIQKRHGTTLVSLSFTRAHHSKSQTFCPARTASLYFSILHKVNSCLTLYPSSRNPRKISTVPAKQALFALLQTLESMVGIALSS